MYLISPQQLEKLETLTPKKTAAENISDKAQHVLEAQMEHLLKQPGSGYSKSLQYNDLLEKYLALLRKEESRDREILLKVPTPVSEKKKKREEADGCLRVEPEDPSDHIPTNCKNATYILQKLGNSNFLRWNHSSEIIVQDKTIQGSHIFNLMKTFSYTDCTSGLGCIFKNNF